MNIIVSIFAFIFGSIPWGFIIGKLKGIDLRKTGSGNIGTTNVLRVIGKKEALATLLLDISKGFIPVMLLRLFYEESNMLLLGFTGIAAILGHCFTPFLKFKGGKGVATSVGVILAFSPLAGLTTVIIWLSTFAVFRISSLSALVAFGVLPLVTMILRYPDEVTVFAFIITAIIYLRHLSNIKRLLKGTETKIGDKK
ncbi:MULTISPECIES: glycerol-3-phosphate 1-O-acyltransferase PlsY [Thermodesulfovibrio]|uniref:glycerol-3-phosphate 1-O-acyltransferase PlsY n=1 Tax=Thermodesulfovibrio TaxID=28261 RepID=UPI00263709A8|nr:glycerol-3-phosphate 1-O-acyltransferase PlsY [Thermodesulfovibrio sp.]